MMSREDSGNRKRIVHPNFPKAGQVWSDLCLI